MINLNKKLNNRGYITLMSVLIVGAVGLAITTSIILLGIGNSRTSFSYEQLHQAKALSNACAEEALEQIRNSISFLGNYNITFGNNSCDYNVVDNGSQNRTITTNGNVGTTISRTTITISKISPLIVISSWQEGP